MTANDKFKLILMNMEQEEVFNFIWIYDQYIQKMVIEKTPLNIEDFYHTLYKKEFKLSRTT